MCAYITRPIDTVERYDPERGGRIGAAVAVYQEKLYIAGGYQNEPGTSSILNNVLCFDLHMQRWWYLKI